MSTYYMRDGILYTMKTMCNLVEFWQHEARVYPDEQRLVEIRERTRDAVDDFYRTAMSTWLKP